MNDHQKTLVALQEALPRLSERDRSFADSLLTQAYGRGVSENQMKWIRILAERGSPVVPAATNVGDFTAVVELFRTAKQHLKFPKIRFLRNDGSKVVLSLAGAQAHRPDTVNVTDGRPFGQNTWYGRVTPEGEWQPSSKVDAETSTSLVALLSAFSADPGKVAGEWGRMVSSCIFCSRTLSDERSKLVGYGPICAGHYNLPWG